MKARFGFIYWLALGLLAINVLAVQAAEREGVFAAPKVEHVAVYGGEGLTTTRTVFSYKNGTDEVLGATTNIHFTIDSPVKDVWPIFQDFNAWMSDQGFSNSGVYGDKEGELLFLTYEIGFRHDVPLNKTMPFIVQQLIPQQLIVLHSPLWEGMDAEGNRAGFRHEGKNAFILSEVQGKTVVTGAIEHTSHYYGPNAKSNARAGLEKMLKIAKSRKKDVWEAFVPNIKALLKEKK